MSERLLPHVRHAGGMSERLLPHGRHAGGMAERLLRSPAGLRPELAKGDSFDVTAARDGSLLQLLQPNLRSS